MKYRYILVQHLMLILRKIGDMGLMSPGGSA